MKFAQSPLFLSTSILALLLCASGCGSTKPQRAPKSWLSDGSITISRSMPEVSQLTSSPMLGFMPFTSQKNAVTIDLSKQRLSFRTADGQTIRARFAGKVKQTGNFTVSLIEENPVWHASKDYYSDRGLETPKSGSKERYLKAILGEQAIYLSNGAVIYSSKHKTPYVDGINLKRSDFRKVLKTLKIGDSAQIK